MREANLWEDDSDIPVEAFVRGDQDGKLNR